MNGLILAAVILLTLLVVPQAGAQQAGAEALSVSALQQRLRGTGDALPDTAGRLVAAYPRQAPEVICTAINVDASRAHEIIAATLAAGASGDQVPPACACTETNEGITSLVQGSLTNGISAPELAAVCLQEITNVAVLQSLLADLLATASRDDFEFILATAYDTLVSLRFEDPAELLVNTLVQGDFLAFGELGEQCGEACMRPVAETLVQNIINVPRSSDLVGGPEGTGGEPEPPPDPEPPASSS